MPWTKGFPKNTEINTILTFTNEGGGGAAGGGRGGGGRGGGFGGGMFSGTVGSVTPTADSVTLREHHSFAELPDAGYKPRVDDPRSGFGALQYADYAAPITTPLVQRFIRRHRLEKVDPTARVSEAKKPIIYYVDRGTPEPTRTALLEGARWWNQAFEAAGYRNAFRVELLPEGADPMDIRYNMINWVHRSTRGWSTGASIADPRTGEIIKATVTLGSLRDRQDYLIFEGLLAPYKTGTETPAILAETAMARIRQLAAHEVGHTLGIGHQYYNSTKGRISVMDYPHPLEKLNADGTIDLSDAYAVGIGEWDKVAIAYGYQDFRARHRREGRAQEDRGRRVAGGPDLHVEPGHRRDAEGGPVEQRHRRRRGADADHGGPPRRAQPLRRDGHQERRADGDHGRGAGAALHVSPLCGRTRRRRRSAARTTSTRSAATDRIAHQVGVGRAAARRARRAGGHAGAAELALPKNALDKIPPRPSNWGAHREMFTRYTGEVFDPISPAAAAADVTIGIILSRRTAPRGWWRSTRSTRRCPDCATSSTSSERRRWARRWRARTNRKSAAQRRRVLAERLMALAGERADAAGPRDRVARRCRSISGAGFGPGGVQRRQCCACAAGGGHQTLPRAPDRADRRSGRARCTSRRANRRPGHELARAGGVVHVARAKSLKIGDCRLKINGLASDE